MDSLLIDANSYGMTAVYNFASLTTKDKATPTGVVHGVLMQLFALLREYPQAVPIVLWDGRAQWRYDLYPEYKSGRDARPDQLEMRALYRSQVGRLREMLQHLGLPQLFPVDEEADDLAGHLAPRLARYGKVTLCTKDTDWLQVVSNDVAWYSHPNKIKKYITPSEFPTYGGDYGFANGRAYLQACALAGDDSDKIGGIDKVGEKTAAQFLLEFGSPEAFWTAVDAGTHVPKGKVRERLASAESRAIYARNLQLMDWSCAPPLCESTFLWTTPFERAVAKRELLDHDLRVTAEQLNKYEPQHDFRTLITSGEHPLLAAMRDAAQRDETPVASAPRAR